MEMDDEWKMSSNHNIYILNTGETIHKICI